MSQVPYSPYAPAYALNQNNRQGIPTNSQFFTGFIQDGKIFQSALEGPQPIGVTTKLHEDVKVERDSLFERCQEYYDALVEAGVIVPEPTQEQIMQLQAEQIREQAEQLKLASQLLLQSQETQHALLEKQDELAQKIEQLSLTGGASHEHTRQYPEQHTGPVTAVEGTGIPSVANSPRVSKQPTRPAAGDSGKKPQPPRSAKGNGVSAKRPSRSAS